MATFKYQTRWGTECDCFLEYDAENHMISMYSIDPDDGCAEPFMTVTATPANGACLMPGFVAVKNYSENEGILDALIALRVLDKPVGKIPAGFVHLDVCKVHPRTIRKYGGDQ